MATHSSVLAWRIPGTGEPDGLSSLGSHRVRHDWSALAAAAHIYASTLNIIHSKFPHFMLITITSLLSEKLWSEFVFNYECNWRFFICFKRFFLSPNCFLISFAYFLRSFLYFSCWHIWTLYFEGIGAYTVQIQ